MATQEQIAADARKYLLKVYPDVAGKSGKDLATAIRRSRWTPTSNVEIVELLATAYALASLHDADVVALAEIRQSLNPPTMNPDPARVFVQGCYKEGEDLRMWAKKAGNLFGRYAGAVRYLQSQSLLPSEVGALGRRPGEGVSAWETRNRKTRGLKKAQATPLDPVRLKMKIGGRPLQWDVPPDLAERWMKVLDREATPVPKKAKSPKSLQGRPPP